MIAIEYNEGEEFFSLNGKKYPQVYQAIALGANSIAIHSIHDTRNQLISTTHYREFIVNGASYSSQDALVQSLIPILYDKIIIESGGITDEEVGNLKQLYLDQLNF